jgi:hypothetical protein
LVLLDFLGLDQYVGYVGHTHETIEMAQNDGHLDKNYDKNSIYPPPPMTRPTKDQWTIGSGVCIGFVACYTKQLTQNIPEKSHFESPGSGIRKWKDGAATGIVEMDKKMSRAEKQFCKDNPGGTLEIEMKCSDTTKTMLKNLLAQEKRKIQRDKLEKAIAICDAGLKIIKCPCN